MSEDPNAARAVVERYVEACRTADVDLLKSTFHPQAMMNGYLGPELMVGSPEPFFAAVEGNPPPAGYDASIDALDVTHRVAHATLRERNYLGTNFVNHFHLIEAGGEWKIVAKVFETHD